MKTIAVNRFPEIPERELRREVPIATWLAARIDESEHFERLSLRSVSALWFRYVPPRCTADETDAMNASLLVRVNQAGNIRLAEAMLDGRLALRLTISGPAMQGQEMQRAWESIASEAAELRRERPC